MANNLGDFVSRLRSQGRWSRQDIAERAKKQGYKISQSYIASIETGETRNPSIDKLRALAAGLGVDRALLNAVAEGDEAVMSRWAETRKPWPLHDLSQTTNRKAAPHHGFTSQQDTNINLSSANLQGTVSGKHTDDIDIPGAEQINGWVRLPVYGIGSCGDPMFLEDVPEGWEVLPSFIGDGADGILRARGLSMVGNGIREGDLILFRRLQGERPAPGKEVVAAIDGQCTVKIYKVSQNFEYLESAPGSGAPAVIPIDTSVRLVAQVTGVYSPR